MAAAEAVDVGHLGALALSERMLSKTETTRVIPEAATESALRTVRIETDGLNALAEALSNGLAAPFAEAVSLISGISGRVIVTGVGKSGHIGSKIAATFASTGTPANFVHPVEASHGDLGMITSNDAVLALSWSGESEELKGIVSYCRRFAIPLVALTSGKVQRWRARPTSFWPCRAPPKPARMGWRLPPPPCSNWPWAMRWPWRFWRRAASRPTISGLFILAGGSVQA